MNLYTKDCDFLKGPETDKGLSSAFYSVCVVLFVIFAVLPVVFSVFARHMSSFSEEMRIFIATVPHQIILLASAIIPVYALSSGGNVLSKLGLSGWKNSFFLYIPAFELLLCPLLGGTNLLSELFLEKIGVQPEPPVILRLLQECNVSSFVIILFSAVILAPVVEEIIFRRVIYGFIADKVSPAISFTMTSFLFALIHQGLSQFMSLFILALALQFIYVRTKSIYPCILLHFLQNSISVTVVIFMRIYEIPFSL